MIKVLNLYAGIGGNRKLWDNVDVTAVEIEAKIAAIYQDFFPDDKVIITDAHQYLLEHYNEFDFIWSSPPCPSHSMVRINSAVARGQNEPIFPDMKLYEEVIFLQHHCRGKYCVENVKSYYEPLIKPQYLANHFFWANFHIAKFKTRSREHKSHIDILQNRKGFDLSKFRINEDKKKLLRNCVEPETGYHIFKCAYPEGEITVKDYYKQEVLI